MIREGGAWEMARVLENNATIASLNLGVRGGGGKLKRHGDGMQGTCSLWHVA